MTTTIKNLIARQREILNVCHVAMRDRPESFPRAAWLHEQDIKNITFYAHDTAFKTRPVRGCYLGLDHYLLIIKTEAGRTIESFDIRADDAEARFSRYLPIDASSGRLGR